MVVAPELTREPETMLAVATRPVLILVGPPGCGKGTQARILSDRLGIPCISTGEILRSECVCDTQLGRSIREIMGDGGLVSDELVNVLVAQRISAPDCQRGFILDGYPRSMVQAEDFQATLNGLGDRARVIVFDIDPENLVGRLTARRSCPACGRVYNLVSCPPAKAEFCDHDGTALVKRLDDEEDIIRKRFTAFEESTAPLLSFYGAETMIRVDACADPQSVSRQIEASLRD